MTHRSCVAGDRCQLTLAAAHVSLPMERFRSALEGVPVPDQSSHPIHYIGNPDIVVASVLRHTLEPWAGGGDELFCNVVWGHTLLVFSNSDPNPLVAPTALVLDGRIAIGLNA